MLLVDEVDNKEFLTGLFHAMHDELPALKPKKRNKQFPVDISLILGNLITVIVDYQIPHKPLKILSL